MSVPVLLLHSDHNGKNRHRIGLALARLQGRDSASCARTSLSSPCPDFLPIEALLELFANLLPSAKAVGGKEKRAQFIEQVFNAKYFSNSQDIVGVLEGVVSDWSATSQKISDLIASEKLSLCANPVFVAHILTFF